MSSCSPRNRECRSGIVCVDVQPFYCHEVVCRGHTVLLVAHLGGVCPRNLNCLDLTRLKRGVVIVRAPDTRISIIRTGRSWSSSSLGPTSSSASSPSNTMAIVPRSVKNQSYYNLLFTYFVFVDFNLLIKQPVN